MVGLSQIVDELTAKNVIVEFMAAGTQLRARAKDPFAKFQLNNGASFAQLESSISKERQAQGFKAAVVRGV
ncbi:recombinase family protein [Arthrobacter livingstonensis]|uniref:recombinase family protein n=1 Tax=Arthrobacter livingstonensis TaxID=670078 RepID=UPI001474F44B